MELNLTKPAGPAGDIWEWFVNNEEQTLVYLTGGFGCIAGEVLVETSLGPKPVRELADAGEYFQVWSWSPEGYQLEPARAYYHGKAHLWRVLLSDGREITAIGNHGLLTPSGWRHVRVLSPNDAVLLPRFDAFPHRTSLEPYPLGLPQGVLRWRRIARGYLRGCLSYLRSCGGRLRAVLSSDRYAAPSLAGAGQHSPGSLRVGEPEPVGVHTPSSFSTPPSTGDSPYPPAHPDLEAQGGDGACNDAMPPCRRPNQGRLGFVGRFFRRLQARLSARGTVQTETEYPSNPPVDDSSTWGSIKSITYAGYDDYYDVDVPTSRMYVANGIVNHNGGKSNAIATSAVRDALMYPGAVICICRADLTVLKRTTMQDLLNIVNELNVVLGRDAIKHNKNDSAITFPEVDGKKSIIWFFGLMSGDYERKLKSLQPFRLYIDELKEVEERMLEMAVARCRAKVHHIETGKLGRVQVKCADNDFGNNWPWRRFVGKEHPGDDMTKSWARENVGIRTFKIPNPRYGRAGSTVEVVATGQRGIIQRVLRQKPKSRTDNDNPELFFELEDGTTHRVEDVYLLLQTAAAYIFSEDNWSLNQQNIENFYYLSEDMRKQFLEGRIDTKSGVMFPMFDTKLHVIPEQEIPRGWRRIIAIDHGLDHPTAAVFIALNPNGDLLVYDEYEQRNLSIPENAYEIRSMIDGGLNSRLNFVGDPKMWAREALNPSLTTAKVYMEAGCKPMRKADNRRDFGWDSVRDYLTPRMYPGYTEAAVPRLWVTSNCFKIIERLRNFSWEDANRKVADDLMDALRYGCVSVYNPQHQPDEAQTETPGPGAVSWDRRSQVARVTESESIEIMINERLSRLYRSSRG